MSTPCCLFCGRPVPEPIMSSREGRPLMRFGQPIVRRFCCHRHEVRQQNAIRKLRKTSPAEAIA